MHVVALLLLVAGAAPKPGTYVRAGASGTLVLQKGKFRIDSTGANAHVCSVSGTWSGEKGLANDEGERCDIGLVAKGDDVEVTAPTTDACRSYCGARASFDGTFFTPPKGCAAADVKKTRASFKALYDQKQYPEALAALAPLLTTCERVLDRFDVMWIRNDLALTQHKAGRDAECLATLEPLSEYRDASLDEPVGYEPAYQDVLARIAKATRTNAKLCGFVPPRDAGR